MGMIDSSGYVERYTSSSDTDEDSILGNNTYDLNKRKYVCDYFINIAVKLRKKEKTLNADIVGENMYDFLYCFQSLEILLHVWITNFRININLETKKNKKRR